MNAPSPERDYQQWLQKVEEDLWAGDAILREEGFAAPACFHFQQAAEKLLKALLVYRDVEFRKTHDLTQLAALIEGSVPDIRSLADDITYLNRYYVETRYPGDYPEFSRTECREAGEAARRIEAFVLAQFGQSNSAGAT